MSTTVVTYQFTISGAPRTKKTHNQAVLMPSHGKGQPCPHCRNPVLAKVFPSGAWRAWVKAARISVTMPDGDRGELRRIRTKGLVRTVFVPADGSPAIGFIPLESPFNCAALFWRDADRGDAVGYYQGLADLLAEWGVIADDRQIVSWNGSELLKDAASPRVYITLEALP
jgi:hypothetical protein